MRLVFEFQRTLAVNVRRAYNFPTKLRTALLLSCCFSELVEDVEVAFALYLSDDTTFLQQIVRDLCANGFSVVVEHNLKVFTLNK